MEYIPTTVTREIHYQSGAQTPQAFYGPTIVALFSKKDLKDVSNITAHNLPSLILRYDKIT